jgi:hypothetical protein
LLVVPRVRVFLQVRLRWQQLGQQAGAVAEDSHKLGHLLRRSRDSHIAALTQVMSPPIRCRNSRAPRRRAAVLHPAQHLAAHPQESDWPVSDLRHERGREATVRRATPDVAGCRHTRAGVQPRTSVASRAQSVDQPSRAGPSPPTDTRTSARCPEPIPHRTDRTPGAGGGGSTGVRVVRL